MINPQTTRDVVAVIEEWRELNRIPVEDIISLLERLYKVRGSKSFSLSMREVLSAFERGDNVAL